jgi:predicted nuclease with TOPRIM domain
MASGECEEINGCVITLEQEKSELLVNLSNLQTECTKLKSKLSNVKKDCDSYIAALQEEVVSSSA